MSTRPTLADLPKFPVVGGTMGLAVGVTIARLLQVDVSALYCDPPTRFGEPWRLVTSALPHVNVMHLVFNVMMMWGFGWYVEAAFGHLRTLGLVLLFAAGSAAGEYAFLEGGIGLSGVLYGLFGMLLVLSHYDPRHRGIIPSKTAWTLTVWFFLCIVLTYAHLMPVANIAHGAGWLLGSLVGWAIARPRWRWPTAAATAALTAGLVLLALVYRPRVNFLEPPGTDEDWMALRDLKHDRPAAAEAWSRRAVAANPADGRLWNNLGVALYQQNKGPEADAAFAKSAELAPKTPPPAQPVTPAPPAQPTTQHGDGTD
ncbi:MAG TPA: rhomboid family intramembrane serine protease [Humisphaera sp.]